MKKLFTSILLLLCCTVMAFGQQRRPIDNEHPLWLIHIDVWNKADPQKIIDLIPENIRPYVCMNLSLSCQYDTEKNVYKMPQNAVRTYKSWASICQKNGLWFTCQPASGGHTHIQDDDIEIFEYFYKAYPNFLGWNYAEQFWGFDEKNDKSSSTQASRIALFAKLVPMAHKYGGFLTVSFCGNIWSHPLNPVGMLKRNKDLMQACKDYPEAMLWLFKYTTSSCWYNNESVTFGPFIAGLSKSYGVRYDNCGYNGALDAILGENHGKKYPVAAGIGTVMEQTCQNGGAIWDGPELIWTEDFQNLNNSTVNGYTRRNWGTFPGFRNAWLDMFDKILDGTMYIPTREEVVAKTKYVIINNETTGNDENKYATWDNLYDGLYKQTDPMNKNNGYWHDNACYFKSTGRYGTLPMVPELYDSIAKTIPNQVKKSQKSKLGSMASTKTSLFNRVYPEISTGDLFVSRFKNQLVTYTPYTYLNKKVSAQANIPLQYNTCESLDLTWGKLSSGLIREYKDSITFYLNNYRTDTVKNVTDVIVVNKATTKPTFTAKKRVEATVSTSEEWNETDGTYTLKISHNGGVDVVIKCQGDGTDRSTDLASSTALPLPKQPEEFHGQIIIEAEDMDYKSIKSCVTDPYGWYPAVRGHAGNGFADMGTSTDGSLKTTLNLKEAGSYRVQIRYNSPKRMTTLTVQAGSTRKAIKLQKTAANTEWQKAELVANMKAGDNTLSVTNGAGTDMYIDQIILTPEDVAEEKFEITIRENTNGTIEPDVAAAEEGTLVTLTPKPNWGYKLSALTIVHGDITLTEGTDGTYSFTMPDDIVTLKPTFVSAPTSIDEITSSCLSEGEGEIYDISGIRHNTLQHGINIIRKNGVTVKKIYMK